MKSETYPTETPAALKQLLGLHTLVEFIGGDSEILARAELLEPILIEAVKVCGATYIDHRLHQFEPSGASGVVLIAESHLSFHSWPEHKYMALDLFTCSLSMDPNEAIQYVAEQIDAESFRTRVIERGF